MSPDDIDNLSLKLHDFLIDNLGCELDEEQDFLDLNDWLLDYFEPFYTKDRNYN